jgi:DNA polymerase III delta' subunit
MARKKNNWLGLLNADPISWLLESDNASVRYFALTDLLDRPSNDRNVMAAQAAINVNQPVKTILDAMHPEGYWVKPGRGYSPKYRSTVWQVIFLDQLGADASDPRIHTACEYIFEHTQTSNGGFGCSGSETPMPPPNSSVLHCLNGNLLRALLGFGYTNDERIAEAIDWQARSITGDRFDQYYKSSTTGPGFACAINYGKPCAWGAIKALRALARVPDKSRTAQVKKAIHLGVEFLLSRDPSRANYPAGGNRISPSWFKLGFPSGYVADVLQNLEVLAQLGYARDKRLQHAIEWLISKQDAQGRWKNQYSHRQNVARYRCAGKCQQVGNAARVSSAQGGCGLNRENAQWNIISHEWAVRALSRSIAANRMAHAYLLTGIHAIGKTTLARVYAQALQCSNVNRPCGECNSCLKIARGSHPDVRVIEGVPVGFKFDERTQIPPRTNDRERRILRIEQIRILQRDLALSPFESRYKVVILRRFEEANEEASNAFLKTLEEPPTHVQIVLTARDASLLLPTIVSRCQVLALRPIPAESIESVLIGKCKVDKKSARLLARLSAGQLGWAVRASADSTLVDARNEHLDELIASLSEGRAERLQRAEKIASDSLELPALLELWLGWWRDVLLMQNGDAARITNVDREKILHQQAERFSLQEVHHALKSVRETSRYLMQNVNARLAIENLLIGLPGK